MSQLEAFPFGGACVHIVDDDPAIRDALAFLLHSCGFVTREWESGEAFLAQESLHPHSCILLDVRMSGMSGLAVFDHFRQRQPQVPVIFLTGHAETAAVVETIKNGAFNFIEKPFNDNSLVKIVAAALEFAERQNGNASVPSQMDDLIECLSGREKQVFAAVIKGRLNKQIAEDLEITMRTVEVHRARVFEKLGVRNAVELVSLVAGLRNQSGFGNPQ
ncbi:MAG: response regulator [Hyphomicrobiales bacterium]|nr:response regulator [Hyphomicrobiales bacterium]MDE2114185.1 response regulator transcription factor [Hyphomicrobiales bacterium]